MDLKKTNYFDPRKMAARKRWTVQETGQGLIAMTGYAYLGDEEKTALFWARIWMRGFGRLPPKSPGRWSCICACPTGW